MKRCPICNGFVVQEAPMILFFSQKTNDEVLVCPFCEKHLNSIMESEKPNEIRAAINYFYNHVSKIEDEETQKFVYELIDNNASIVKQLEQEKQQVEYQNEHRDFFSDTHRSINTESNSDFWISGLKGFAWFVFASILLCGILFSIPAFNTYHGETIGFVILILAFVLAFLTVALLMVFLNMAKDIRAIRNNLTTNKQSDHTA
ncbi:MAG: hypothetical protein ACOX6O_02640 [Christensenellales bacterium]|jgi:uncharacterized protein YbaR (Trm112 family)